MDSFVHLNEAVGTHRSKASGGVCPSVHYMSVDPKAYIEHNLEHPVTIGLVRNYFLIVLIIKNARCHSVVFFKLFVRRNTKHKSIHTKSSVGDAEILVFDFIALSKGNKGAMGFP